MDKVFGNSGNFRRVNNSSEMTNEEPKIIFMCMLCGRNKFTRPTPHKCIGGFRKRKLIWQQVKIEIENL